MSAAEKSEQRRTRRNLAANKTDNIHELIRMRIVRVVRECDGDHAAAAEKLGCSASTVRRYLHFVPFERMMRDPSQEKRFDWRSMDRAKWTRLLCKHPGFIARLPKKHRLSCIDVADILIAQPQLAASFDLTEWNRLGLEFCWSRLLSHRPQLAGLCDFAVITGRAAADLLEVQPRFFDRIPLDTLWAYHWTELFEWQPRLEKKMLAKPHSEWPFNYWVHALQFHPELENEFDGWDRIENQDIPDFERRQPEMYARHWPERRPK